MYLKKMYYALNYRFVQKSKLEDFFLRNFKKQ